MYSVTRYGRPSSATPSSSTREVQNDDTRRALITSAWNRSANPSRRVCTSRTTFTATGRPFSSPAR